MFAKFLQLLDSLLVNKQSDFNKIYIYLEKKRSVESTIIKDKYFIGHFSLALRWWPLRRLGQQRSIWGQFRKGSNSERFPLVNLFPLLTQFRSSKYSKILSSSLSLRLAKVLFRKLSPDRWPRFLEFWAFWSFLMLCKDSQRLPQSPYFEINSKLQVASYKIKKVKKPTEGAIKERMRFFSWRRNVFPSDCWEDRSSLWKILSDFGVLEYFWKKS